MRRTLFWAQLNKERKIKAKQFAELREAATETFFPRFYNSPVYQKYLENNYARHNQRIAKANAELLEATIR